MATAKKKPAVEKKGSGKAKSEPGGGLPAELDSMELWRGLAKKILPDETDDMRIGEIAIGLLQSTLLITKEYRPFSKIVDKSDNTTGKFTLAWDIDRRTEFPTVSVSIGFSEKHGAKSSMEVPDPNQAELPLQVSEAPKVEPGSLGEELLNN